MARITELEEKLHKDTEGTMRQHTLEKLASALQALEQQLRKPSDNKTHQILVAQREACRAAVHTIETLWQRYHNKLRR